MNSKQIVFSNNSSNVDTLSSHTSLKALSCNLFILLFVVLLQNIQVRGQYLRIKKSFK